jgi:RluA family pseudouridine synthase
MSSRETPARITIDEPNDGRRFDVFVRQLLPHTPLGTVMKWLRQGLVRINGRRRPLGTRLRAGDVVSVPPAAGELRLSGKPGRGVGVSSAGKRQDAPPLDRASVLYVVGDLLVVAKPAGIAAHAGSGHEQTSLMAQVLAYLDAHRAPVGWRPGLVQRLDRDVSGVIVIGKNAAVLRRLTAARAAGAIDKRYWALVAGVVPEDAGTIDLALTVGDGLGPCRRRTRPDPAGVMARTRYRVLRRYHHSTLLEVQIETGRQHQIRAHLWALGHPILGDPRYGPAGAGAANLALSRPFLHAASMTLAHPRDGRPLYFAAPLPPDLQRALDVLERQAGS